MTGKLYRDKQLVLLISINMSALIIADATFEEAAA
jgi:hypothetical protein